ncbi:unnamed protein product, partial [Sphacelaria rigidula]
MSTPAPLSPPSLRTHHSSPAMDVWAMGVTLFQMVYGTLPFWPHSGNHHELEIIIKHQELTFPDIFDTVSTAAVALAGAGKESGSAGAGRVGDGVGGGTTSAIALGRNRSLGFVGEGARENEDSDTDDYARGNRAATTGSLPVIEAHDPMSGYLRNLLRRLLEKDPVLRMELGE